MRFLTSTLFCLSVIVNLALGAWSTDDISDYKPDIDYTTHNKGYPGIIEAKITHVEWVEDLTYDFTLHFKIEPWYDYENTPGLKIIRPVNYFLIDHNNGVRLIDDPNDFTLVFRAQGTRDG